MIGLRRVGLVLSLRKLLLGCAFLWTLAIAGSSSAVPLTYRSFVGSLNNFNSFGELGFVFDTAQDGLITNGNFGAAFDNTVTVNTITIDQRNDPGRTRMQNLRIYTSPNSFTTATLADSQAPQTITLPGAGLTSDYFFITVENAYAGADNNPGLTAFTFDGTLGPARTNLNAGIIPTVTNPFDPADPTGVLTNGQIVSTTGGPDDYVFFEHADATQRSVTVSYGSPKTVASVGFGFEGQIPFSLNARPVPRFITVSDSNGNNQQITLQPHTLQYGQYNLTSPFINTNSLTLTLPVGVQNYYLPAPFNPNQPLSTLTGLTEFQAFGGSVVPEPSSVMLVSIAGLMALARRKRIA